MRRETEREAAVARLWQEHLGADFPARLRGVELAGIDMVLLDANIAGCVSAWRNGEGSLDAERHRILRLCLADLNTVLPLLTGEDDHEYYGRLHRLAALVS
ncbi:hypothetical protein [Streptomyces sp. NPDC048196]|uniref:hypothetical protein n=1 Tax=Streptomyces sp. NPDC048196 TaxID=3154712 RepID=UPI003406BB77